jgi:hypothetical protein
VSFKFTAEPHSYHLDGVRLPSVSEVIAPLVDYSMVPAETLAFAASRGKAVHLACEMLDMLDLDEDSVDPRIAGYVDGYRKFLLDFSPQWGIIEAPMYHPSLLYAGTPDRFGVAGGVRAVVDLKSIAAETPAVFVQCSGYDLMIEERDGVRADEMWALYLKPDGTYRLRTSKRDEQTFLGCLRHYRGKAIIDAWKGRNK